MHQKYFQAESKGQTVSWTASSKNPGSFILHKTKEVPYWNWSEDSNNKENELLFLILKMK